MPKVIVPVGFDGGPVWPLDAGDQPDYYEVIVDDRSMQLPEDAYLIWATSMLDRVAQAEGRFERADLLRLTSDDDRITDPNGTIQQLLDSGLLVEFDPEDCQAFLQQYRLYPLAEGGGNTKEHPEAFRLTRRGEVVLELYHDAYGMWQGMVKAANIWEEIEGYAKDLPSGSFNLEQLTFLFARAIPAIVSTRCGFLQPS
jgi:hypothetical protein